MREEIWALLQTLFPQTDEDGGSLQIHLLHRAANGDLQAVGTGFQRHKAPFRHDIQTDQGQIRVHSSYLNHPILNDTLYGGGGFKIKTQEQVLQSYKLEFAKPFYGDIIKLQIDEDEKIKKVLNWLKNKETK